MVLRGNMDRHVARTTSLGKIFLSLLACSSGCCSHIGTSSQARHLDCCVLVVQSDALERRTRVEDIILEHHKALADTSGKITAATIPALPWRPLAATAPSVRVVNAAPPPCYFPSL